MQITIEIKCPTCLSDSIKKNGIKVDGKQNYQCKDCKRQFIGDHALSDTEYKNININNKYHIVKMHLISR
jgi:DNA-directed RNA polymerase subunit RPC12/RpoP